jgi:hypothetical protein
MYMILKRCVCKVISSDAQHFICNKCKAYCKIVQCTLNRLVLQKQLCATFHVFELFQRKADVADMSMGSDVRSPRGASLLMSMGSDVRSPRGASLLMSMGSDVSSPRGASLLMNSVMLFLYNK